MTPLAAFVLFLAAPTGQDTTSPDQGSIDQLIRDLGAADPERRDQAQKQIETMGRDAVPALRRAAQSDNAEQAMRARQLLLKLAGKERKAPAPRMSILYEDWSRGIRYAVKPDGSVELTVPEKDEAAGRREYRTYQADSIEEFKRKYPEVAQKYEIDKLATFREASPGEPSEGSDESQGRRFGILVSPVGPALGSQLALPRGDGLLVRQVEAGSLAEKSGVKPFDVIVALNGEKASPGKVEEFRQSLQDALGTKEFTLELIRQAKRETIRVKPTTEERKSKAK
jgi:hypothetical protein